MTAGAGGRRSRAHRGAPALVALALAATLAACGSDEHTPSAPRTAAPIDVTAKIDGREVVVSPDEFGAGLVNFTVTNLSDSPARFTLSGPTDAASADIARGGVTTLKAVMEEGRYEAGAGARSGASPDRITVGPPRASAQNDLLQP